MKQFNIRPNWQIIADLQATNRWEAIDELINHLVATGKIKPEHQEAIAAAVKKRESKMSTGVGFGIAFPEATTDLSCEAVGALGRSRKGIEFNACDHKPVHLVLLFVVPRRLLQKHPYAIPHIAMLLGQKPELREALQQAPDAEAMLHIIQIQDRWSPG